MKVSALAKCILLMAVLPQLTTCTSLEKVSKHWYASETGAPYAIVDVNVITMDTASVLAHQTVIIRDEKIQKFGPVNRVTIPENARRVSGAGKYLLPGFIDMHVHISDDADLLKFLKYGVTTVRHMSDVPWWTKAMGFSNVLSLRRKLGRQEIIGPDIYTCGYTLDGDPRVSPMNRKIVTREQAVKEVRKTARAGYDFIKIYDNLSPEAFQGIMSAAGTYHLPVVGHVPFQVGIDAILQSSVESIEHLTGYINNNTGGFLIPEEQIDAYAAKTRESGIYNCPTLMIWDHLPPEGHIEDLKRDPEYRYVSWHVRWLWKTSLPYVYDITYPDTMGYSEHIMDISKRMLRALYRAGCPLLIGTDTNFIGVYPGYAALREMQLFSEAGIPNMEILQDATLVPARALGKEQDIGTIAEGKLANLVLLDANPLEDIANIFGTTGVFTRGHWLPKEEIQRMLEIMQ